MAGVFVALFCSYERRARSTVHSYCIVVPTFTVYIVLYQFPSSWGRAEYEKKTYLNMNVKLENAR